jgi:hypothetical protein
LDWQRLCNGLRGKRSATPEVEQAATIFRLQRHGIAVPELLAFGHQQRFCRSVSFLLTESLEAADMGDWLSFSHDTVHRRHVLRQAGDILRRLHIAGYRLEARTNPLVFFAVQAAPEGPRVVLRSADGVYRQEKFDRSRHGGLGHDLERLQSCFSLLCSEAEIAAFLSSYLQRARNIGTMDHGLRTTDVSCGSAA